MPAAWNAIQLGPFFGGINTLSDPSGIEDNELVDCVNLELDLNGSLITRPPIKLVGSLPASTSRLRVIGSAVLGAASYLIIANDDKVWSFNGAVFTEITSGVFASKALQYKDNVYIIPYSSSVGGGGKWNGVSYSAVATMPKGSHAVIYKERMWVPSGTQSGRLFFSNIADPGVWSASDFFDISPGDGQVLWNVAVFNNNLLIFKSDSTFVLSYDTKPADASLDKISNTIGTSNCCCFAQNQNNIFIYHESFVYQLINYEFIQVNPRVVFQYDGFSPSVRGDNIMLSFVGNRLIVRYFNRIYIYNILTQTWTRWEAQDEEINNFSGFYEFPTDPSTSVDKIYYAGSSLLASGKFFVIRNSHNSTDVEALPIKCKILTKDYTFELPWQFKRLFFWGVDVLTNRNIVGTVTPIVFGFTPSWGDIKDMSWESLNTWVMPTTSSVENVTSVAGGTGTLKRFIKFSKSLRFRQIHFKVVLETDGSSTEGPTRFYTITLFLKNKETISKQVS